MYYSTTVQVLLMTEQFIVYTCSFRLIFNSPMQRGPAAYCDHAHHRDSSAPVGSGGSIGARRCATRPPPLPHPGRLQLPGQALRGPPGNGGYCAALHAGAPAGEDAHLRPALL
jgi:hypothetical protein